MKARAWIVGTALLVGAARMASSQQPVPGLPDPFGLLEPKDFSAHRSSSNNPDWNSNDDSKRPIPGETTVLADLAGPGDRHPHVDHDRGQRVRLAAAAAPARLLRRQRRAERRRSRRRLLRRRPRLRARRSTRSWSATAPTAGRATATGRCRSEVVPHHDHERGTPPRRQPLLPRRLGEAAVAARPHAVLPRALPAGAAGAGRRQALRVPRREGPAATTSARCSPSSRPRPAGSARATTTSSSTARSTPSIEGTGTRGLLQRRLGAPRRRRAVLRRARSRKGRGSARG